MDTAIFDAKLTDAAARTESKLADILNRQDPGLLAGTPARLLEAMRHGALGGGKRLRPFLVVESARLFAEPGDGALATACALELVHCYSLVHDDLPAMDDDDLRRGRPTVHKAFDEASAILAGDALLTLAFGVIAEAHDLSANARLALVSALSRDAGAGGMVGGQALDLAAEDATLSAEEIARMQAMKTGALLAFACEAGALSCAAPDEDRARLRRFGETVGLAFQLADDVLDETSDAATLGKAVGKDAGRGKKTLPALHGLDWTRERLSELVGEAQDILAPYGTRAETLRQAARFIAGRDR